MRENMREIIYNNFVYYILFVFLCFCVSGFFKKVVEILEIYLLVMLSLIHLQYAY